MAHV
jgi:transposase